MRVVVFSEHEMGESLIIVYDRQRIELVIPKDIIGLAQCYAGSSIYEFIKRSHEFADLSVRRHAAHPVVPAGHKSQDFALGSTVVGDGDGAVSLERLQLKHVFESLIRS